MCLPGEGGISGDPMLATLLVLDLVILSLVVAVNSFLAAAMLRRRRTLFSACPAARFALSLCLADLAVAGSTGYYKSFAYFCPVQRYVSRRRTACVARFALMVWSFLASGQSLVLLALDRYWAVVHALRYKHIVNGRRSRLMVAAAWSLAVLTAGVLFLWNHWAPQHPCEEHFVMPPPYVAVTASLSHCLVFGAVTAVHLKIHLLVVRNNRGRSPTRSPSAQVLVLISCCYLACWAPFLLVLALRQCLEGHSEVVEKLFRATFTFAMLNYIFNCFIFSWKNKAVRAAVMDLFRCSRDMDDPLRPFTMPFRWTETII